MAPFANKTGSILCWKCFYFYDIFVICKFSPFTGGTEICHTNITPYRSSTDSRPSYVVHITEIQQETLPSNLLF